MIEIGSEFHYVNSVNGKGVISSNCFYDYVFTFCGRTSIETVLRNEPHISKALLPSYCCSSMIEPFTNSGIEVDYYDVNYINGKLEITLDIKEDIDCLLWNNYFGYNIEMPDVSKFKSQGGIVIEDITHSFFSKKQFSNQSDYLVASLRKWEPVFCGGFCAAFKKKIEHKPVQYPSIDFLEKKKKAMLLKRDYLNGNQFIKKDTFLRLFNESNNWLASNYSMLKIDEDSLRYLNKVSKSLESNSRKNNARILYNGIHNNSIDFLFEYNQMDCPLFVPILIKDGKRDIIRKILIENNIYCPVHWPKPNEMCKSNLYDIELSLICDQRYSENDMHRIVNVLNSLVQCLS